MTILILAFLFLLVLLFEIIRYKKTSRVIFLVAFIFFFVVGSGVPASFLLKLLQAPYVISENPHWEKRNAIVLLGAGTIKTSLKNIVKPDLKGYSRIIETARLYLLCKKNQVECTIIVSGGDPIGTGMSEAIVYKKVLTNLNINNSDITIEPYSRNTYQNAEFTSKILKEGKFNKIFLVTSGVHLKRALLYFSHFGISAIPFSSDYIAPIISFFPLGYNFVMADFAIHEYTEIIRFYISHVTFSA